MPRIIYSGQAQYDLSRLYVFLGEKDIAVAQRAMQAIDVSVKSLTKNPTLWRVIEHGLRELIIDFGKSGYIALYDYHQDADLVEILAIRHQLEDDYKLLP
jgi:plasmid stabilization system protein ParE